MQNTKHLDKSPGNLGTFSGVFTPSILTILGIILFLRLGYVVGNAGLRNALIILAMANAISVLTSLSLSAIATNLKVKGGGDYYLISRTLGLEFGGAIGIVLFLAQSVSIGFYCIGFGEVLAGILPLSTELLPQVVGRPSADSIAAYSSDAALVFLPFRLKDNQPLDPFGDPLDPLLSRLPVTALTLAAEDIDLDAAPEEGRAGETAGALDRVKDAEKRLKNANKDEAKAAEKVIEKQKEIQDVRESGRDEAGLPRIDAELSAAEAEAEKTARRSAKAEAKLSEAEREAEALGAEPGDTGQELGDKRD